MKVLMSRLPTDPRLPISKDNQLTWQLDQLFKKIAKQVNTLTEGRIEAVTNADISYPTSGKYNKGDYIRNSSPSEFGTSGQKYIVMGWVCVESGEAGIWKECRALTGN